MIYYSTFRLSLQPRQLPEHQEDVSLHLF